MLGSQLVYKTVKGQIIVSTRPVRTVEASEAQKRQIRKFKYATAYAKGAIADDLLGPIYAEAATRLNRVNSAYHLALTDYLKSPEIGDLDLTGSMAGHPILVEAYEDPKLDKVEVTILDGTEAEVAVGEAMLTVNGIQWEYVLPTAIPDEGKIVVRAYDLPGNVSTKVFDL